MILQKYFYLFLDFDYQTSMQVLQISRQARNVIHLSEHSNLRRIFDRKFLITFRKFSQINWLKENLFGYLIKFPLSYLLKMLMFLSINKDPNAEISNKTFRTSLFLLLEGVKTLICRSPSEKFNIVSNDHGHTQKCNFCVSNSKTNFKDHDTPDTINGFRDSVKGYKMHDCYWTICKNFGHIRPIRPFHQASDASGKRLQLLVRLESKPLQNAFKRI